MNIKIAPKLLIVFGILILLWGVGHWIIFGFLFINLRMTALLIGLSVSTTTLVVLARCFLGISLLKPDSQELIMAFVVSFLACGAGWAAAVMPLSISGHFLSGGGDGIRLPPTLPAPVPTGTASQEPTVGVLISLDISGSVLPREASRRGPIIELMCKGLNYLLMGAYDGQPILPATADIWIDTFAGKRRLVDQRGRSASDLERQSLLDSTCAELRGLGTSKGNEEQVDESDVVSQLDMFALEERMQLANYQQLIHIIVSDFLQDHNRDGDPEQVARRLSEVAFRLHRLNRKEVAHRNSLIERGEGYDSGVGIDDVSLVSLVGLSIETSDGSNLRGGIDLLPLMKDGFDELWEEISLDHLVNGDRNSAQDALLYALGIKASTSAEDPLMVEFPWGRVNSTSTSLYLPNQPIARTVKLRFRTEGPGDVHSRVVIKSFIGPDKIGTGEVIRDGSDQWVSHSFEWPSDEELFLELEKPLPSFQVLPAELEVMIPGLRVVYRLPMEISPVGSSVYRTGLKGASILAAVFVLAVAVAEIRILSSAYRRLFEVDQDG